MMMTEQQPTPVEANQRWYQKDKTLLTFVGRLQKMPVSLMETYCKCIIDYATVLYQEDNTKQLFIEAGSEKHQSLLKSLDKKRWCDKNPFSYRAFNALYLMDELRRNELVVRLTNTQDILQAYNQRCLQCNLKPSMAVLGQLLLVYVRQGEEEALMALNLLESQGNLEQLAEIAN